MRAFVALDLTPAFEEETVGLARSLKRNVSGRFMRQETYHVTLAFLGEIDETQVRTLMGILDDLPRGPILLGVAGLTNFGRPKDCTLVLELRKEPALMQLAARLVEALDHAGIDHERRNFLPHLTIARRAKLTGSDLGELPFPTDDWATGITLYRSTLTKDGAHYKVLHTVELDQGSMPSAELDRDASD